ncbi:MAG TPA: hypothetical protein VGJ45_31215 [Pseudonocardiaceae bacterium]
MAAVVLACGVDPIAQRDGIVMRRLPARPGKDDIDPILDELDGRRLVVAGTDADLAAVVLRLLRTERVTSVDIGYLPSSTDSVTARIWQLPTSHNKALDVALSAPIREVPLVRDDNGGVLVGAGTIAAFDGVAYCDDTRVLSGRAKLLLVTPDPDGVRVTVRRNGLLRRAGPAVTGRACQLGGELPEIRSDGVPHGRPMPRWTWYRHTEDLRLALR